MVEQKKFEGRREVNGASSILKGPLRKKRPRVEETKEENAACFSHRKVRLVCSLKLYSR